MLTYSNPAKEEDKYSLPDVEIFYSNGLLLYECLPTSDPGWYWWFCFPGCMPDSDPNGPFSSEEEALKDIKEVNDDNY